jgi:hypothetical protein
MAKPKITYFHLQPKKEKAVGRCHHNWHKGNMSAKMVKTHKCLGKQCPYFEKYEDHPYWKEREAIKAKKKQAKICA